jgi:hypothetical protein
MSKKKTFGTNLVEMKHKDFEETSHVVESAFRNVWSKRGWTLVEDEGSKESDAERTELQVVEGELPESATTSADAPKPSEPAKLTALKAANTPKKEQG